MTLINRGLGTLKMMDARIETIIGEFMSEIDLVGEPLDFISVALYKLQKLCEPESFQQISMTGQVKITHLLEVEILDCIKAYKAIPLDLRNQPLEKYNNKTGKQIFMEQMHIIDKKVEEIRVENVDTHSLLVMHEKLKNDIQHMDSKAYSYELAPQVQPDLITEEAKRFVQSYQGRKSLFEAPLPEVVQKDFLTPTKLLVYFVAFITLVCGISLLV